MKIQIDRTKKFDPELFFAKGWTIEIEDERSLALDELDLSLVTFETCLEKHEYYAEKDEALKRFREIGICLDAKIFLTLWENKHLIPEEWKGHIIGFWGTIFNDSRTTPYDQTSRGIYIRWDKNRWHYGDGGASFPYDGALSATLRGD
jgi:hypothetical protein